MNKEIDDGGPAFPVTYEDGMAEVATRGMSLRDWFAGQALAGMMANQSHNLTDGDTALCSYALADALLAASKSPKQ